MYSLNDSRDAFHLWSTLLSSQSVLYATPKRAQHRAALQCIMIDRLRSVASLITRRYVACVCLYDGRATDYQRSAEGEIERKTGMSRG